MTPAEEVAAALASSGQITLRDLQIALEWQRSSEHSVLDVLVFLELTDAEAIRAAVGALAHVDDLAINDGVEARREVDRRRSFTRLDLPEGVVVKVNGKPVGGRGPELLNLSLGGLGYSTDEPPRDDQLVDVFIRSRRGSVLEAKARARYRRQVGDCFAIGVEFDGLSPARLMVLDSILKELAPQTGS
ncbi:MAG: PilZ domain-containing protein [Deltaproteobacteria bacterium]|nr:PilZ domain-containing protein [Deltaproteobacteria bacterium]